MDIGCTTSVQALKRTHDDLNTIATMIHARNVSMELDHYPRAATWRPGHFDCLLSAPDGTLLDSVASS